MQSSPSPISSSTSTSSASTKYTIPPIQLPQQLQKLQKYLSTQSKLPPKSSLCRFYLRGICILKPQYCKFAHSTKQLSLSTKNPSISSTDKQKPKKQLISKLQFNQPSLFILKNIKYYNLYQFQFTQRYKITNLPIHTLQTISENRNIKIRIRQIMHRHNWDGFLYYIENTFPQTNYPISFFSYWYGNFGFDKPSTRCKFTDFIQYAINIRQYVQLDIIFPPNTTPSLYLINPTFQTTILSQNLSQLSKLHTQTKSQQTKLKLEQSRLKPLPPNLTKKYLCRYFMSGYCQHSNQSCLYAHSIQQLASNYELAQVFPNQYRQPVLPLQMRKNYISLYHASRKYPQFQQYTLQDINLNSNIKTLLRQHLHKQIFQHFLILLQKYLYHPHTSTQPSQIFYISYQHLQKYFHNAGFNHTNQNKFHSYQNFLWSLGYYMNDVHQKNESTSQNKKSCYIYKIHNIQYFTSIYSKIIKQCVDKQLQNIGNTDNNYVLQSSLKRTIYSQHKKHMMPLHTYLKYRNITFHQLILQFCPSIHHQHIFFQSAQQNVNKLISIIKKQLKKNKKYILKIQSFQSFLKSTTKNQINLNHHFLNLKQTIQITAIDVGKKIYFWPFENNLYLIDPQLLTTYSKQTHPYKDQSLKQFTQKCQQSELNKYLNERIIIVDHLQTFIYATKYLQQSNTLGVDLQGKLSINGYVDLIQISACKRNLLNHIQHKQIFIFDIFLMKPKSQQSQHPISQPPQIPKQPQQNLQNPKNHNPLTNTNTNQQLYTNCIKFLKHILQNQHIIKILHDCRHDSIALKYILNINLKNVFDTSGFDIYLYQKQLYQNQKSLNSALFLRKLYDIKIPNLNTILDTYKAPNGINILKSQMKKRFGNPQTRSYFQKRPIDDQFLQYSARDVQDLIQIYYNMMQHNSQHLSEFIGSLYSKC